MTAERDRQKAEALAMQLAGDSIKQIAEAMGLTEARARKLISDALDDSVGDVALSERARIEIARIDRILARLWGDVENGNLEAIDRFVRLSERREKLAAPRPNTNELTKAFDRTAKTCTSLIPGVDDAIVQLGRQTSEQIDYVIANGNPTDVTKALYLQSYIHKALREMLATPAARADVEKNGGTKAAEGKVSKLAQLRSVAGNGRAG